MSRLFFDDSCVFSVTDFSASSSLSDGLSGLVVDKMASRLVVQSAAAWVEIHKRPVLEALVLAVDEVSSVAWRPETAVLRHEGVEVENDFELYRVEGSGATIKRESPEEEEAGRATLVRENSIKYSIRLDMQNP